MSETPQAGVIGSSQAEKTMRYFFIGGALLIIAASSALVVFGWVSNSLSVIEAVNVLVGLLNLVSPVKLGYLPPEAQLYIAELAGFYGAVFLLVGAFGGARSPQDYFGGAALIALAIFAYTA